MAVPYFCVECGAFQNDNGERCSACGAKSESAARVDLLARVPKEVGDSEFVDELPEEVVSRSRYIWFKVTRPWRRLWRRGLMWQSLLIAGACIVAGVPIAGAIYWYDQQRCDAKEDVVCLATVVRLVTPVSGEFVDRFTEPATKNELSTAAEVYDAIILLGLAWSDDQKISYREVAKLSAGDSNICTSALSCTAAIQAGENIDYDGVSGSVYLAPDGVRGTYLTSRRNNENATEMPDPSDDRLIGQTFSDFRLPTPVRAGSVLTVVSRFASPVLSQVVKLADYDLRSAGIDLQIDVVIGLPGALQDLGEFIVLVDAGFQKSLLSELDASEKIVIAVTPEWRKINGEDAWLRLSAHPGLLAELVLAERKSVGDIVIVGRCGFEGRVLATEMRKLMSKRGLSQGFQNDGIRLVCNDRESIANSNAINIESPPTTLIVAASINSEMLLRTLFESGYIGKIEEIIVLGPRLIRLDSVLTPSE